VMLRARRHLLEGVGGVVHDNERPRLCLAVVIVDKIEGVAALSCLATYRRRAVALKIIVGSVSMMADAASMTASCRLSNLASCAPSFLMDYPQDGPKRRGAPRSRNPAQAAA
jgi:hypothetical protein